MAEHSSFLAEQLRAGSLIVAGPVMDPKGVFGMGVFEADDLEGLEALLEKDPARAIGHYEIFPMGPAVFRPAHPIG